MRWWAPKVAIVSTIWGQTTAPRSCAASRPRAALTRPHRHPGIFVNPAPAATAPWCECLSERRMPTSRRLSDASAASQKPTPASKLAEIARPKILLINKVDLVETSVSGWNREAATIARPSTRHSGSSALTVDGVADVKVACRARAGRAVGTIRGSDPPTRRCTSLPPPISRARSFICGFLPGSCVISPRRDDQWKELRTARPASSNDPTSSAKASARSCSARAYRPSGQSGGGAPRDRRLWSRRRCIGSYSSLVRERWCDDPELYEGWASTFQRSNSRQLLMREVVALVGTPCRNGLNHC